MTDSARTFARSTCSSVTLQRLDRHSFPSHRSPRSVLFAVDGDGCCEASGAHRPTSQTVNGGLYFAQRFANDWMWLDEARRLVNSNAADVHQLGRLICSAAYLAQRQDI